MTPPSDTDRIIAAHREESRRTRALLLWIFVGVPLVAGLIWGLVLIATQPPAVRIQSTYTGVDVPTSTTQDPCNGPNGELPAYAWCAMPTP